jgi:RNA polymerase sigma factor (TIGR02999 family)
MNEVTRILKAIEQGDPHAGRELLPLVYEELRKLATARLAQELKPGVTLQATALVHEAYLRLAGNDAGDQWDSRGHFFAAAAEAMRRILVEQSRRRNTARRGGGRRNMELLNDDEPAVEAPDEQLLDLDAALTKFQTVDAQAAEVVKLRVFAGLTVEDAAKRLGISERTAKRNWAYARSWLRRQIERDGDEE